MTILGLKRTGATYTWSTNVASSNPGTGVCKASAGHVWNAGEFYTSITDADGKNQRGVILACTHITLTNPADATQFCRFLVTGAKTDNTTWIVVPVTQTLTPAGHGATDFTNAVSFVVKFGD